MSKRYSGKSGKDRSLNKKPKLSKKTKKIKRNNMNQFIVIEGDHKDPNDFATLDKGTENIYGPFENKEKADNMAKTSNTEKYR